MQMGKTQVALGLVVAVVASLALWQWSTTACAQQDLTHVQQMRGSSRSTALDDPTGENQLQRLREGVSLVDEVGTFSVMGDRIAFQPNDEKLAFGVLENLALERVWKVFDDTRDRQWCVSGAVTEYRGRNYLLLTRAVLRAQNVSSSSVTEP